MGRWLLVLGLRPLCRRVGTAWRYGLANIARRGATSVAQSVALGLGIMAILLLTVVRGDLLANWQADCPPALEICQRGYVLETGNIILEGVAIKLVETREGLAARTGGSIY